MVHLPKLKELEITRQDIYDNKAFTKEDIDKIITVIIDSPKELFDTISKKALIDIYYQVKILLKEESPEYFI